MADRAGGSGGGGRSLPRWFGPVAVAVAVLLAAGLQLYRIAEPPGGFHSFNETFYTELADHYADAGPLAAVARPRDLNNPPLYPLLAAAVYDAAGSDIVGPRSVSIIAGLAAAVLIYALTRVLYNERIAMWAAIVFALMPGVVLVGRSAQTDMLLVALELAAMASYVLAVRGKDVRFAAAAGALLGAALLTKLSALAVLAILALWNVWRTRSFAWLRERTTLWALGAFGLVGLPWYVWFALSAGLVGKQGAIVTVAGSAFKDVRFFTVMMPGDLVCMSSALGIALAVVGIVLAARKRTPADLLVLSGVIVNLALYVAFHFHSYYLLPIAPFLAMAAGRLLDSLRARSKALVTGIVVALVLALGLSATMTLAAKKWGHWTPARVADDVRALDADPAHTTVHVDGGVLSNDFAGGFARYSTEVTTVPEPLPQGTTLREGDRHVLFTACSLDARPVAVAVLQQHRPVVLGYALYSNVGSELHTFMTQRWKAERVGPVWRFGIDVRDMVHPAWVYYDWPVE